MNSNSKRMSSVLRPCLTSQINNRTKPKFKNSCNWIYESKFHDQSSAEYHLKAEEIWYCIRSYSVQGGLKKLYHCNRAKTNGTQCREMKCLFYPGNSNEVWMYKTKPKHNHDKTNKRYQNKVIRKNDVQLGTDLQLRNNQLMKQRQSSKTFTLQLKSDGFDLNHKEDVIKNVVLKKQNNVNNWVLENSFDNLDKAKSYLKEQKIWSFSFQRRFSLGTHSHYRCNLVPKIGPQCAARKYFRINKETNFIELYKRDWAHTHSDIMLTLRSENNIEKLTYDDANSKPFREIEVKNDNDCSNNSMENSEQMKYKFSNNDCGLDTSDIISKTKDLQLRLNVGTLITDSVPNSYSIVKEEIMINDELIVTTPPAQLLEDINRCSLPTDEMSIYSNSNFIVKEEVHIVDKFVVNPQPFHSITAEIHPHESPAHKIDINSLKEEIINSESLLPKEKINLFNSNIITVIPSVSLRNNTNQTNSPPNDETIILDTNTNDQINPRPSTSQNHFIAPCHSQSKSITANVCNQWKTNLIKHLNVCDQKALLKQNFRVLKTVNLRNYLSHIVNYRDTLSNDNNFESQIIKENVNLCGENDSNNSEKTLFSSKWIFETKFTNEQMALDYLTKDDIWTIDTTRTYAVKGDRKVHYRCNRMMPNNRKCAARKCLFYSVNNNEICLYKKVSEHTHDEVSIQFRIKRELRRRLKYGDNFKSIKDQLDSSDSRISSESRASSLEPFADDDAFSNYIDNDDNSVVNEEDWVFQKSFDENAEARKYLRETNWSLIRSTRGRGLSKSYFRCNLVKRLGPQCNAQIYLLRCLKTNKTSIYRNLMQHTHNQIPNHKLLLARIINNNEQSAGSNVEGKLLRSKNTAKSIKNEVKNINSMLRNTSRMTLDKQIELMVDDLKNENNNKQSDIVHRKIEESVQSSPALDNLSKPILPPKEETVIVDSVPNQTMYNPLVDRNHYKIPKKSITTNRILRRTRMLDILKCIKAGEEITKIAEKLKLTPRTVRFLLKNEKKYKSQTDLSSPRNISKSRNGVIKKTEKLLSRWIEDKSQRNIPMTEMKVRFKAKTIFEYLNKTTIGKLIRYTYFHPSRKWLRQFMIRNNYHNIEIKSKKTKGPRPYKYSRILSKIINEGKYLPEQVFSVVEVSLFWKRLPNKTFITKEEKSASGYKASKERLTLILGYNAAGDFKMKPMLIYYSENPNALNGLNKSALPVIWKSNKNGQMNSILFEDWFKTYFCPTVKSYLQTKNINNSVLLLLDKFPRYSANIFYLSNVKIEYLPKSIAALNQETDEGVISRFKAFYLQKIYMQLIDITKKQDCVLIKEFWQKYSILDAINNIEKSWEEIELLTLKHIWTNIWPVNYKRISNCIYNRQDIVRNIINLGNQLGFKNSDQSDITDWIKSHREALSTDDVLEVEEHIFNTQELLNETDVCDALNYIEKGLKILCDKDPIKQRSSIVRQKINEALYCYKQLKQK